MNGTFTMEPCSQASERFDDASITALLRQLPVRGRFPMGVVHNPDVVSYTITPVPTSRNGIALDIEVRPDLPEEQDFDYVLQVPCKETGGAIRVRDGLHWTFYEQNGVRVRMKKSGIKPF